MKRKLWLILLGMLGTFIGWLWLQERKTAIPVLIEDEDESKVSSPPSVERAESSRVSATQTPDMLTEVKGIGPSFEKALNEIGVFTFAQLAEQDPKALADKMPRNITEERIIRDTWIEQAAVLRDKQADKDNE